MPELMQDMRAIIDDAIKAVLPESAVRIDLIISEIVSFTESPASSCIHINTERIQHTPPTSSAGT